MLGAEEMKGLVRRLWRCRDHRSEDFCASDAQLWRNFLVRETLAAVICSVLVFIYLSRFCMPSPSHKNRKDSSCDAIL